MTSDSEDNVVEIEDPIMYEAMMGMVNYRNNRPDGRPSGKMTGYMAWGCYCRILNAKLENNVRMPLGHSLMVHIANGWKVKTDKEKALFTHYTKKYNDGVSTFVFGKRPKTIWKESREWLCELSFSLYDLPALLLVEIYDCFIPQGERVPMHLKWDVITKIKHFHKDN